MFLKVIKLLLSYPLLYKVFINSKLPNNSTSSQPNSNISNLPNSSKRISLSSSKPISFSISSKANNFNNISSSINFSINCSSIGSRSKVINLPSNDPTCPCIRRPSIF